MQIPTVESQKQPSPPQGKKSVEPDSHVHPARVAAASQAVRRIKRLVTEAVSRAKPTKESTKPRQSA